MSGEIYIREFGEIGAADIALVGGKNASLGEMFRELKAVGVLVPDGFAVTTGAYRYILDSARAWDALRATLHGLEVNDVADLARRAARAREIIYSAPIPDDLKGEIVAAYRKLSAGTGAPISVAVRSSATAEDLPSASFAGQHESFLNVCGEARLLDSVRHCFASLFKDRAIRYRVDHGFDHFKVLLSVGVMKMVRSDLASSGVIFTLDTETGFRDAVFVTGVLGLGENIVQGTVDPDEFYVFKPTLAQGFRRVLRRSLGAKKIKMVYADRAGRDAVCNVPTSSEERRRYCLTDEEVLTLAEQAVRIEAHYTRINGCDTPMDIEWAKDGVDGRLYVVQARPETVASRKKLNLLEEFSLRDKGRLIVRGRAVGARIASGCARVITNPAQLAEFQPGEVLVADATTPDWGTVMKSAAGIITNRGGRTCHAAIVARELGVPAVVGCGDATAKLKSGTPITVSCAEGDTGNVYAGTLPFEVTTTDLSVLPRPPVRLMVNVANPDTAFQTGLLPSDGVGLARVEFIVAEHIRVHPMALVRPDKVLDAAIRDEIGRLTEGYANPADFFVDRLAEGVATLAAAFYPRPVIVRLSDFKTNEYASLLGGKWFEPAEENPMLGFRGASRYAHPAYAAGFALECEAMKRVRDAMGLVNVKLMIPFVRRVQEAEAVLRQMAACGLRRGENGLEIYIMCEIPNNVIQVDAFARLFDGFSIGSNDLTQLVLGVDRDSEMVAFDFDERDAGVKQMIRMAIEGAHRNHRPIGICGQAPSDYPDMADFLIELGIDSISLSPDSLLPTLKRLAVVAGAKRV